jgi:hypothetical protein
MSETGLQNRDAGNHERRRDLDCPDPEQPEEKGSGDSHGFSDDRHPDGGRVRHLLMLGSPAPGSPLQTAQTIRKWLRRARVGYLTTMGGEARPDPDPVADLADARTRIDLTLLEQAAQLDAMAAEMAESIRVHGHANGQ